MRENVLEISCLTVLRIVPFCVYEMILRSNFGSIFQEATERTASSSKNERQLDSPRSKNCKNSTTRRKSRYGRSFRRKPAVQRPKIFYSEVISQVERVKQSSSVDTAIRDVCDRFYFDDSFVLKRKCHSKTFPEHKTKIS